MSPQCAACKTETPDGYSYPFYLGLVTKKTTEQIDQNKTRTTTEFTVKKEPEYVFFCTTCLLKPGVKWARIGAICGLLLIPTIVGTIPGIAGSIYLFKYVKNRKKAISGVDKEFQRQYLLKEKVAVDALGNRMGRNVMKSRMKADGVKNGLVYTTQEFNGLKTNPSVTWL